MHIIVFNKQISQKIPLNQNISAKPTVLPILHFLACTVDKYDVVVPSYLQIFVIGSKYIIHSDLQWLTYIVHAKNFYVLSK